MNEVNQNKSITNKITGVIKHSKFLRLTGTIGVSLMTAAVASHISAVEISFDHLYPWLANLINFSKDALIGAAVFNMMAGTTFYEKTQEKIAKLSNEYVNFNQHYVLDKMEDWAVKPENVESIIKHTLMGLYFNKHGIMNTNYTRELDAVYREIGTSTHYFNYTLIELAQNSPQYATIFQKVYEQDFKNSGLFGQALFMEEAYLFKAMVKGFGGKINLTQEDLAYMNFYTPFSYSGRSDTKDKLKFLFEKNHYIQLPKALRERILLRTDTAFLEPYKGLLSECEKQIETMKPNETSIIQDIETQKIQDSLEKVAETPISKPVATQFSLEKSIHDICEQKSTHLTHSMTQTLHSILEKAQQVYQQSDKLSVEESVEFKNYMEIALPKYLSVFSKSVVRDGQNQAFLETINLLNNYLDSTLKTLEQQQTNEFLVADTYFKNKLAQYRDSNNVDSASVQAQVKPASLKQNY